MWTQIEQMTNPLVIKPFLEFSSNDDRISIEFCISKLK